jgi:hypothetical protein
MAATPPLPRVGATAIDAGTVARIVQARATAAGFDPAVLSGHSLKRGALSTGMDRGVPLNSSAATRAMPVLDVYLELGDPFEAHPPQWACCERGSQRMGTLSHRQRSQHHPRSKHSSTGRTPPVCSLRCKSPGRPSLKVCLRSAAILYRKDPHFGLILA